jgi:hypothetical protein
MALPSARYRSLKLVVIGLMLSWVAAIHVFGVSRELRLMGPIILLLVLPIMLNLDELLYRGIDPDERSYLGRRGGGDEQPLAKRAAQSFQPPASLYGFIGRVRRPWCMRRHERSLFADN